MSPVVNVDVVGLTEAGVVSLEDGVVRIVLDQEAEQERVGLTATTVIVGALLVLYARTVDISVTRYLEKTGCQLVDGVLVVATTHLLRHQGC